MTTAGSMSPHRVLIISLRIGTPNRPLTRPNAWEPLMNDPDSLSIVRRCLHMQPRKLIHNENSVSFISGTDSGTHPSSGVRPMVVSTETPFLMAAMLAPAPTQR